MKKTRVAILRGGPSSEYEVSLRSGHRVREHMPDKYDAQDIFIDKKGNWHHDGVIKSPEKILRHFDVIFNAMHGEYGEDGKVQKILETHNMPYNGSDSFASSLAMNKIKTKQALALHGIKTPKFTFIKRDEYTNGDLAEIYGSMPRPMVVKPSAAGSSVGVFLVNSFEELLNAVNEVFKVGDTALIEEFVSGREATCSVMDHSNGCDLYTLFPVEIKHNKKGGVWDYESKYADELHEIICPSAFSPAVKAAIQEASHTAHSALGLRHYSRSDFIVNDKDEVYFLEVNTLPGLTETSLHPVALESAGISMAQFIDHVLTLALKGK